MPDKEEPMEAKKEIGTREVRLRFDEVPDVWRGPLYAILFHATEKPTNKIIEVTFLVGEFDPDVAEEAVEAVIEVGFGGFRNSRQEGRFFFYGKRLY